MTLTHPSVLLAQRVLGAMDRESDASFFAQFYSGEPLRDLPQISEELVQDQARDAKEQLGLIDRIELDALPHDMAISVLVAKEHFSAAEALSKHYWVVNDLGGVFPSIYPVTSYGGGFVLGAIHQACAAYSFEDSGDCDRYLALMEDYARLLGQMLVRLRGQAERGIRINRPQLMQARALLSGVSQSAGSALRVDFDRIKGVEDSGRFVRELEARVDKKILPGFEALGRFLDIDYEQAASEDVGLCSLPGGDHAYADLIRIHLTMNMTAQEVHQAGLDRMASINSRMHELRDEMGEGTEADFHAKLKSDRRFVDRQPSEVEARFNRFLRRIEPSMSQYFHRMPEAGYGVKALPLELAGSMTFGYYDAPREGKAEGHYLFNPTRLEEKSQAWAGALIYHELIPGHHYQISRQMENENLTGFRKRTMFTSYAEGWAEYAATIAGEMGMYENPLDAYGRCISDAFLTSRLVVDTGMNAFGWSLEKARDYMRQNTFFSESEICSETLRYSSDIPAQALAYKLGDTKIFEIRARAQQELGEAFDIRDFHDAVLDVGSIPLGALEWHMDRFIEVGSAAQ